METRGITVTAMNMSGKSYTGPAFQLKEDSLTFIQKGLLRYNLKPILIKQFNSLDYHGTWLSKELLISGHFPY